MENNTNTVGPLKKVSLVFTAGTAPELTDLIPDPAPLEFIFGIGTQGLTGFECVLNGKQSGDQGVVDVSKKDLAEMFGHIFPCGEAFPVTTDHFYLHYRIKGISDTTPREVVKFMAAATACGSGCDCGCGSH